MKSREGASRLLFYDKPHQMEPLLPSASRKLEDAAVNVVRAASALGSKLHPITQSALAELLRNMNSYYSNRIEGHEMHPLQIERALHRDFDSDPALRALQLESVAHVSVQRRIEERLKAEPTLNCCTPEFLCWIHEQFYKEMPRKFRYVRDKDGTRRPFKPGMLRDRNVEVGLHVPPERAAVSLFLKRFCEFYDPGKLNQLDSVLAAAAAHHRLAWIHPFIDGNGRVTRLFTDAYLRAARLDAHGLWTISRGFARRRNEYFSALQAADSPRRGDLDGRGNLSAKALGDFCFFFLETALDQIEFMTRLLELDQLETHIGVYLAREGLGAEPTLLLISLFSRGAIARGDAGKLMGLPPSTARLRVNALLQRGLLTSMTPKGPLRLAFPVRAAASYFPLLFPEC